MTTASHIVLPGSQRSLLAGSHIIGKVDPDQWIEVTLKLRRKAPLPALTERPKTPLTQAELTAKYGAAADDLAKVKSVCEGYGLEVVGQDATARTVRLGGPISAMEKAFQVRLFHCAYDKENYRGRSGAVHLPAELEGIVVGVFGLDDRRVVRRRLRKGHPAALTLAAAAHRGFFPAELAKRYDFPPGDGAGQTIGILEFGGGFFPEDLKTFCQIVQVPVPNVVPVSVHHMPTNTDDDAAGEVMLDIEVIAGICPKATLPVYFGQFSEQGWIDTLDAAIHDPNHQPTVLSISWGSSEDGTPLWTAQAIDAVNESFKVAALLGITICVASGDDGADDQVGDGLAHVDFPASSPFVLAVGGTDLRVRGGESTERAWKDGDGLRNDGGGSSGGGTSVHFDRPDWQAGIHIVSINPGAKVGRCIPDVAAHAQTDGRTTGYFMVIDGQAAPNGGTSAAAPLWAALIARLNAALGGNKRVGYLNPVIYQPVPGGSSPVGDAACKDITEGDNMIPHTGGYSAGAGYDAVTGWGSPLGGKLLAALRQIV